MARCEPADECYQNLRCWGKATPVEPLPTVDNLAVVHCPNAMCSVRCESVSSLAAHISAAHYAYAPFECNACSARLPTMNTLLRHCHTCHGGLPNSPFVVHVEPTKAVLVAQCLDRAYSDNVRRLLAELVDAQIEDSLAARRGQAETHGSDDTPAVMDSHSAADTPPVHISLGTLAEKEEEADDGAHCAPGGDVAEADTSATTIDYSVVGESDCAHWSTEPPPIRGQHCALVDAAAAHSPMALADDEQAAALYAPPSALRRRARIELRGAAGAPPQFVAAGRGGAGARAAEEKESVRPPARKSSRVDNSTDSDGSGASSLSAARSVFAAQVALAKSNVLTVNVSNVQ